MTISLLKYISDVKSEIKFWTNEITFYINEIKLSNDRIDLYLTRSVDEYQQQKLNTFKINNERIVGKINNILAEIDDFDDSLLTMNNNTIVTDDTFEKYSYFKEKLDIIVNEYMAIKDKFVRFTISTMK
ncbi:hypothetical protein [Flammeovirga pacifica]|uniref:Uncharacterized protein n=1 Tax=Flammeovirga pacifica TaxID=915059 RepID=A0A1S1YVV9_FLAPC|nr:hypothetical protein [Flammeovirga pacifica]OHX65181.1 hypothetical protein NH26_01845 [Flammeovirga pacifica]